MEVKPAGNQPANAESRSNSLSDALRREPDRQTAGRETGLTRDMRFAAFAHGDRAAEERKNAFARKMSHALAEIGATLGSDGDMNMDGLRLLATAGGGSSFPMPADATPARDGAVVAATPTTQAIVERVEAALAAQPVDAPVTSVSLKLDLSDIGGNISGLTISLSPTGIDLVLTRGAGEANAPFIEAAQALADRLHVRFAKRVVRVMEIDDKPAAVADGLGVISELLSRPAGRRDL